MVFNEIANYDFVLLTKQGRNQLICSIVNMFLKISGRNCPVALHLIAGSASKTCQYHLEQWFSNFMSRGPLQKTLNTCGPLLIN